MLAVGRQEVEGILRKCEEGPQEPVCGGVLDQALLSVPSSPTGHLCLSHPHPIARPRVRDLDILCERGVLREYQGESKKHQVEIFLR